MTDKAPMRQSVNKDRERDPLVQRGEKQGTQGGGPGGEAEADTGGQAAQTRPGGSAPGGQEPERARDVHSSQGPTGAQGSGGGDAERGVTQNPDARNRTSGAGNT